MPSVLLEIGLMERGLLYGKRNGSWYMYVSSSRGSGTVRWKAGLYTVHHHRARASPTKVENGEHYGTAGTMNRRSNDNIFGEDNTLLAKQRHRRVLRLVLQEGRKHQVRRMCREMLGMHAVQLIRTRIGSIDLGSLPEGQWRPLRQDEVRMLYES